MSTNTITTFFKSIWAKIASFFRIEREVPTEYSSVQIESEEGNENVKEVNKEKSENKKVEMHKAPIIRRPNCRRICFRGFRMTFWFELALLVIRHFVPEIEEQIPAVYAFIDNIMLPIINWMYAIAMKAAQFVMSDEGIATILEWLSNLAM